MLALFSNLTYRHLFAAQIVALIGTGLTTVALGLLAFELAHDNAGAALGTALAIKMLANVFVAPVASAYVGRWSRRRVLVSLDIVRAAVAACLPFITEVWQIYLAILVLQSASAAFTPTFQATIPDILPDEKDYTKALSLSRLAYDLESVLSPMLAALLLMVASFHYLFAGTVVGFLISAALVVSVSLPSPKASQAGSILERTTRGIRIYLATPRLRGLLALNLSAAAAGSLVLVNTVVYVQRDFGLDQRSTAMALAAFGVGSMAAAIGLPRLLETISDRSVMLCGAAILVIGAALASLVPSYGALIAVWSVIGIGYSTVQTPSGRLLRRSSNQDDRPALFAAQFALSHACWLLAYPLAGWLGTTIGLSTTALAFAVAGGAAALLATVVWPHRDPEEISHRHDDLPPDHPHLTSAGGHAHSHSYVIDGLHRRWPDLIPAESQK